MMISTGEMIVRLLMAAMLGAVIGLERERLERNAGLRTHTLVAVGSCLMMLVSAFGFGDAVNPARTVVLDPSRVAAQVVSGIGFLGAGTIILRKNAVRGLTTAASVWAVAGLGLAVGGGLYGAAVAATVLLLVVLVVMRILERKLFLHKRVHTITVELLNGKHAVSAVARAIDAAGVDLQALRLLPGGPDTEDRLDLAVRAPGNANLAAMLEGLSSLAGVHSVVYNRRVLSPELPESEAEENEERRA
ncbi:MAG: MgtC/SapB family protein [Chloroflexota bacterium]